MDINVVVKIYQIPSLPFQDIEKPKRHRRTNGQCEKQYNPPQTQFAGVV